MRVINSKASRIVMVSPALVLVLSACSGVTQPAPPQSRLQLNQQSASSSGSQVEVAGVQAGRGSTVAPALTYTVKRTTTAPGFSISGTVVPARSAQLTLRGGGTVTAVHVRSGDSVKAGDPLVEFTLDDQSLQSAQSQATLAELAAESEESKLEQLKAGADASSVAQLQAVIQADQANIQKLQRDQTAAQQASDQAAAARAAAATKAATDRAAAKEAADRRVARAEITVQAANDSLAAAKAAQSRVGNAQEQAKAAAKAAVDSAASGVRAAQRRVDQANIQLSQAQLDWAGTKANQDLAQRQLAVDQDNEALKDAKANVANLQSQSPSTDHTARQIDAEVAQAATSVKGLERTLARDQLSLDQVKSTMPAVNSSDDAATKIATLGLAAAKEGLTQAQGAQQHAQDKLDAVTASPAGADATGATDPAVAQAAVKEAQHRVDTETLNLQDAQAQQAAFANDGDPDASGPQDTTVQPDPAANDSSIAAVQAQLKADQAKLSALQSQVSAADIKREQTRATLLRDQANATAADAQPVVVLTAPFDATVTDLGVTLGQAIVPQSVSSGSVQTTTTGASGQASGDRTLAVQLAAAGGGTVLASVSESDVTSLNAGQPVHVDFTGLPGQSTSGTIADVSGAATVTRDNNVAYPVHIDISQMPSAARIGMSVQVSVDTGNSGDQNVLVAPREALRTVDGQSVVSKIDSGQVLDVPVQVGRSFGSQVEFVAGVAEGDVLAIYSAPTAPPKPQN